MMRVTVYLKSGGVAEFDALAAAETADHPKFRFEFAPPEDGGRRLLYLDRDDVSAVVVEERPDEGAATSGAATAASAPIAVPETIRREVQEAIAIASVGAADLPAPEPRRRRRSPVPSGVRGAP